MALLFDGAGDVGYVGGAPTLASFTMAGWFYIDSTLSQYQPIILRFGDPGGSVSISLGVSAAGLMTLDSSSGSVVGPAVSTGTWYYAACVRSGTTHTLYMAQAGTDVSLTASGTYSIAADTGATVAIGGNGSTSYLNGGVAYMRLWSSALTLAELKLEKASTTAVKTSTLWADYRTPNSGSSLNDSSGNSRNLAGLGSVGSGPNPSSLAPIALAASVAAAASASASLSTQIRLASSVAAATSTTAALSTAIRMQAAVAAAASASAELTTGAGGALDFGSPNATRYHTAPIPNLPNADWTLGFWCRFARTDGSAYQYALSAGSLGGNNSVHVFIGEDGVGEARKVYVRAKGASGTEFNSGMSTSMAVDTGTPRLVVVQRRGSNLEIYCVDKGSSPSAPDFSGAHGLSTSIGISTLTIGQRADIAADRGWRNPLGEVFALTSDSLTAAEVTSLAAGAHIAAVRATRALDLRFRADNASEPDESGNSRDSTRYGTGYALVEAFFPDASPAQLEADVHGVSSASASLTTSIRPAASISVGTACSAALATGIRLVGDIGASTAASGALTTSIRLAAGVAAASSVTAALSTAIRLAAPVAAASASTSTLSTAIRLAASVHAQASASGTLTGTAAALAATVAAQSAAGAALSTSVRLQAGASAASTASAELTTSIALSVAVQAKSSTSAGLAGTAAQLSASIIGQASATSSLSTSIRLAASAAAASQATAELLTAIRLSATAQSVAQASAALSAAGPVDLEAEVAALATASAVLTT